MEGTETLCPHITILNHRWLPGTRSQQNPLANIHWRFLLKSEMIGFQVNPLFHHNIMSPFPSSGNEGYVRNRDVYISQF